MNNKWAVWTPKEDAVLISLDKQFIPVELMVKHNFFPNRTKIAIEARRTLLRKKQREEKE